MRITVSSEPWMENAKCYNDEELLQWQRENREDQFFDDTSETRGNPQVAKFRRDRAREYCAGCSVREDCLDYALREEIRYGIYGGLTYRDRQTMKRRARRAVLEFLKRQQVQLPDGSVPNASEDHGQQSA